MPPQSVPGAVKVVVSGTEGNEVMTKAVFVVFVVADAVDVEVAIVNGGQMRAEPEPTEPDKTSKDLRCGRAVPPMALVRTDERVCAKRLARG